MIEFTCSICEHKYNTINGEPEERMCYNCLEYDGILDEKIINDPDDGSWIGR